MRILIVDDHELIQNALRLTVRELDAHCEVVAARDFNQADELINANPAFDLVLLDLGLPGMHGLKALSEMRSRHPQLPVVVVSAQVDRASVIQAINLGAMGYIPKTTPGEAILSALRTIVSGGIYVPADLVRGEGREHGAEAAPAVRSGVAGMQLSRIARLHASKPNFGLTPAQMVVLRLLLRGLPNKLICRQLNLAESTVKSHLKCIFAALDVSNRTQAVLAASELGIGIGSDQTATS
ncbi:MAG: response regulator transcription factor [Burkholderiales bacterium]|nr:response regulator transcription factor [Burkholderiales bacterium]